MNQLQPHLQNRIERIFAYILNRLLDEKVALQKLMHYS